MIVNHVSRLLGERRLSIKDLERGTGVSYNTLYDWYAGRIRRFDADVLDKLCRFFDVPVGEILEHRIENAGGSNIAISKVSEECPTPP